jgi:hypothetical protein
MCVHDRQYLSVARANLQAKKRPGALVVREIRERRERGHEPKSTGSDQTRSDQPHSSSLSHTDATAGETSDDAQMGEEHEGRRMGWDAP